MAVAPRRVDKGEIRRLIVGNYVDTLLEEVQAGGKAKNAVRYLIETCATAISRLMFFVLLGKSPSHGF
eukprot:2022085-Amphidinium_carterae.1